MKTLIVAISILITSVIAFANEPTTTGIFASVSEQAVKGMFGGSTDKIALKLIKVIHNVESISEVWEVVSAQGSTKNVYEVTVKAQDGGLNNEVGSIKIRYLGETK